MTIHVKDILRDLKNLEVASKAVATMYSQTPAKLVKNAMEVNDRHYKEIHRFCNELLVFEQVFREEAGGGNPYYYDSYFKLFVRKHAAAEPKRYSANELLSIHVGALHFFLALSSSGTAEVGDIDMELFFTERELMVTEDKIKLPGTDTGIAAYLEGYQTTLGLHPTTHRYRVSQAVNLI